MPLTGHPLHRSGRAELPHPAPTLGNERQALVRVRRTDARNCRHTVLEEAVEPCVVEYLEKPRMSASSTQVTCTVNRCGRALLAALTYSLDASRRIGPALCPDIVTVGRVPLGPPASLDRLRSQCPGVVRRRPRYYQAVRLLAVVHHRRTSIDFPMRSAAPRAAEDHEISRFPYAVLPCVRGVSDRAGSQRASRWRHAEYGLPLLPTASAPRSSHEFRGSIPGPHVPLSTLRRRSHPRRRMTRGRRGSLDLQRVELASIAPRRFSRRSGSSCAGGGLGSGGRSGGGRT